MNKLPEQSHEFVRKYNRVTTKSIIVSLSDKVDAEPITGFLRDISEGGMRIQKLSSKHQMELKDYYCHFFLPELGKVEALVKVLGYGDSNGLFGDRYVRMRFVGMSTESEQKIRIFILSQSID